MWKQVVICLLVMAVGPAGLSAQKKPKEGKTVSVSIKNSQFNPGKVSVGKGDTVVWTNNDDRDHTVVDADGAFQSGTIKPKQSFRHTFRKEGKHAYACKLHPRMKGSVTVE